MRSSSDLGEIRIATVHRNLALCRDLAILCHGEAKSSLSEHATAAIRAYNDLATRASGNDLGSIKHYAFDWWVKRVLKTLSGAELHEATIPESFMPLAAELSDFVSADSLPVAEDSVFQKSIDEQLAIHLVSSLHRRPPLSADASVVELDLEWPKRLAAWEDSLREASLIIAHSPAGCALVLNFVGALLPIHNRTGFAHKSTSMAAIPGAIYLSAVASAQMLAEAIIHEADHQFLYQLTTLEPLLAATPANKAEIYRSPWRPDPRPAHGLLFGASAFSRVAVCFVDSMACDEPERIQSLGRRATLALHQSIDASQTLRERCCFEAKGKAFLHELESELKHTQSRLKDIPDWRRWEREASTVTAAAKLSWHELNSSLV